MVLLFSLFAAKTKQHCCKLTFMYLCVYLRDGPQRVCWPKPDDAAAAVAAFGCSHNVRSQEAAQSPFAVREKRKKKKETERKISVTSASKI